jgi:uncharacterized protein
MRVYIRLGSKCNFSCKYCLQQPLITKQPVDCGKHTIDRIKSILADRSNTTFLMWGGEPLLYWGEFMECVKYIHKNNPAAKVVTISNGSLLTADKVAFLNKYNIGIAVSGDGRPTEYTRGKDMFKDPAFVNNWHNLKVSKGICVTLNALNQDIHKDVWGYYDEILQGTEYHTVIDFMSDYGGPPELKVWDYGKLHRTLSEIADGFVESVRSDNYNAREYNFFRNKVERLMAVMNNPSLSLAYPRCGTTSKVTNTDLQGNIFVCQNSDIKISTLDNLNWPQESREKFAEYNRYTTSSKCQECPYFALCGGACPLLHGEGREITCRIEKLVSHIFLDALQQVAPLLGKGH